MKQLLIHFLVCLLAVVFLASGAAAATVTITPLGNGSFTIQGSGMDGVAGIELTIGYDSSAMNSPKIDQGGFVSGSMFTANPNFTANSIRIGIIRPTPFSGGGQLAQISFATTSANGSIAGSYNLLDSKANYIPGASGRFAATDFQPSSANNTDNTVNPGSSILTSLGTVSMPGDVQARNDPKPADPKPAEAPESPAQTTEPAAVKPSGPPVAEKQSPEQQKQESIAITSFTGILEDFRTYKDEKSIARLTGLFNKQIAPAIRQEPAVALSDGKTSLKIMAEIKVTGDRSPNFALNGAKLVSLGKSDSSIWIIEALPQAGSVRAGLTILTDSDTIEYPLTLAPPIEGVSAKEAEFVNFLKDSGAATPKRDLNGDGKHDYLDDYIYTANYLVKKSTAGKTEK